MHDISQFGTDGWSMPLVIHNNLTAFNLYGGHTQNTSAMRDSMYLLSDGVKEVSSGKLAGNDKRTPSKPTEAKPASEGDFVLLETVDPWMDKMKDAMSMADETISDVDLARESTASARLQILGQIRTAIMAQAGQLPLSALQLVG